MPLTEPSPRYCAYLLRCWEEPPGSPAAWRFSLEDPHTGERRGFASLESLMAYLQELTGIRRTDRGLKHGGTSMP